MGSISDVLEEIRFTLASSVDSNVRIGMPVDSTSGIYLFPYKYSEDAIHKKNAEPEIDRTVSMDCLLIPNPPDNYVMLDEGLRCLNEKLILASDERTIWIGVASPTLGELTQIYASAGVALRLSIPFTLRWAVPLHL